MPNGRPAVHLVTHPVVHSVVCPGVHPRRCVWLCAPCASAVPFCCVFGSAFCSAFPAVGSVAYSAVTFGCDFRLCNRVCFGVCIRFASASRKQNLTINRTIRTMFSQETTSISKRITADSATRRNMHIKPTAGQAAKQKWSKGPASPPGRPSQSTARFCKTAAAIH